MPLAFQPSLFDGLNEPRTDPRFRALGAAVERIALSRGAWLDLRPGWLADSDVLFERLVSAVPWLTDRRPMYDRIVDVPRLVCSYSEHDELPDPLLSEGMAALNSHYRPEPAQLIRRAGLCFYRTGSDSVAWHGDHVGRTIDQDTMVAILSLGDARTLSVRPKDAVGDTLRFPLGHGDLIVMGGSSQRTHEHAILKTKGAVGPRISVQYRPVWPR